MFNGPIEDRILIRERYGAYSDAAFRQDVDAWLENWCEKPIWKVFGRDIRGKEAMRAQWEATWQGIKCMGFFAEIGAIVVEGEKAKARSYCREIVALKNVGMMKVVACYNDELVKKNGVWRFAVRDYNMLINESELEG